MSEISWDKIDEKKRRKMTNAMSKMARKFASIDYSKKAGTSLITKAKFYAVRMLQTRLGKENPEYTDYNYWKSNGWLGSARPWKAA